MDTKGLILLGKSDVKVPRLGVGTWQWGDRMMWNYASSYTEDDTRAAFQVSIEAGVCFFDTAEVYGMGLSEKLLGKFLKESRSIAVVATKFMPFPWRLWKGSLRSALRNSLERLDLEQVDLYQIHQPLPPVAVETWMDALADVVEAGLVRAVGVSNYNVVWMRRAYAGLSQRGVPLATNQVEYSLLDRRVEKSGLLALCQELGVTVIAYSPIAKGVLTGKYTPQNIPPGLRSHKYNREYLERMQPLIRLLRDIGQVHEGKTPAQVALNWVMCKEAVAIPGAKNARQAQENAGALGWRLTDEEISSLDAVSDEVNV